MSTTRPPLNRVSHSSAWLKHLTDVSNNLVDAPRGAADAELDIKPARYPVRLRLKELQPMKADRGVAAKSGSEKKQSGETNNKKLRKGLQKVFCNLRGHTIHSTTTGWKN